MLSGWYKTSISLEQRVDIGEFTVAWGKGLFKTRTSKIGKPTLKLIVH